MSTTHAERRHRLQERLEPGEALLLFGAHHHLRNGDSEYRYRPDSDIVYLTGWTDPECALFLKRDAAVFFVQPKDPKTEVWTGIRPGPAGAAASLGIEAFANEALDEKLPGLLTGVHTLHYAMGTDADRDRRVLGAVAKARKPARHAQLPLPDTFVHPQRMLHEHRLIKAPDELQTLKRAAAITDEAFRAAMAASRPGVMEYEIEALIDYTFRRRGGTGSGYGTIVGGGKNGCVLHYVSNGEALRPGELLLVDAGCELDWYTADVTRTWPISGAFSPAQREVYEVVLEAQLACIDACRVGSSLKYVHDLAIRRLTEGMIQLGLLKGSADEAIEKKSFLKYYMHGTSHWLGLDVHDAGAYILREGGARPLQPGMVLTVEPGLYIAPDDLDAPEHLRGIGVRIEDDVHVTATEPEVLTSAIPKTVSEVETACAR